MCKAASDAIGKGAKVTIGDAALATEHGDLIGAAGAKIVIEDRRRVVTLRGDEADFRRAGDIGGYGIGDASFGTHLPRGVVRTRLRDACHEPRRHLSEALVVHAAAARHVVVGKLQWDQGHFIGHALVPKRAAGSGGNQLIDHGTALAFERGQHPWDVVPGHAKGAIQRDRVVKGKPRSRTDRKMPGA